MKSFQQHRLLRRSWNGGSGGSRSSDVLQLETSSLFLHNKSNSVNHNQKGGAGGGGAEDTNVDVDIDNGEEIQKQDGITTLKKGDTSNTSSSTNNNVIIIPIVVTDDIFLRQRILEIDPTTMDTNTTTTTTNHENENENDIENENGSNINQTIDHNIAGYNGDATSVAGYVMTFHQLWHLLVDVKQSQ